MIAENDVRRKTTQRFRERAFGPHMLYGGGGRESHELAADQDGVIIVVLEHEHANLFHTNSFGCHWNRVCQRVGTTQVGFRLLLFYDVARSAAGLMRPCCVA